jgi:hypothetical protein
MLAARRVVSRVDPEDMMSNRLLVSRVAAAAFVVSAASLLAIGCDFIPKKVTKDDCKAWA